MYGLLTVLLYVIFPIREMAACIQGWDKIVIMGDDQAQEHYKAFTDTPTRTQCVRQEHG